MSQALARSDFPVVRRISTRWADVDVYGHVNNVLYYSYFDTAVNGYLLEATGTDIRRLPAIGVVVESGCSFRRSLTFPEDVEAALAVTRLGSSSVTYEIGLFQGSDPAPAGVGPFVHVYVDAGSRRPVRLPEQIRTVLEPLRR